MNNRSRILLGLTALACVVFIGWATQSPVSTSPNPSGSNTATSSVKTYSRPEYGVSFAIPERFLLEERMPSEASGGRIFAVSGTYQGSEQLQLSVARVTESLDSPLYSQEDNEVSRVISSSTVVDGVPAKLTKRTFLDGSGDLRTLVLKKGDFTYEISVNRSFTDAEFDVFVASLHLTTPTLSFDDMKFASQLYSIRNNEATQALSLAYPYPPKCTSVASQAFDFQVNCLDGGLKITIASRGRTDRSVSLVRTAEEFVKNYKKDDVCDGKEVCFSYYSETDKNERSDLRVEPTSSRTILGRETVEMKDAKTEGSYTYFVALPSDFQSEILQVDVYTKTPEAKILASEILNSFEITAVR